jgi:agmatinase
MGSEGEARQQSAAEYLRHGQTPFFRLPGAVARRAGHGAVLLGVPYDGGTTYQPGARLAPYHVRRVSAFVQGFHPAHRLDVFAALSAVDGGNVVFPPLDRALGREVVTVEVGSIVRNGAIPFVVGGDHSILLPILRGIASVRGPIALIQIDAHLDTSDGALWGDAFHHGTPVRHALDEHLVAPGHLYQVGIRASYADADEAGYSRARGARVYTMDDTARLGVEAVAAEIHAAIGALDAYVTFDVDAVDPAFAPGTGTPVCAGWPASTSSAWTWSRFARCSITPT